MEWTTINELQGKTMTSVENIEEEILRFTLNTGEVYEFYHEQDCCESVYIEDIEGDLADLVGFPIELAEEAVNYDDDTCSESCTWTYYRFRTVKGSVTVRWLGESNGYYSESVDFRKVE